MLILRGWVYINSKKYKSLQKKYIRKIENEIVASKDKIKECEVERLKIIEKEKQQNVLIEKENALSLQIIKLEEEIENHKNKIHSTLTK